jgi:uncharacterized protein (DUF1810 family)
MNELPLTKSQQALRGRDVRDLSIEQLHDWIDACTNCTVTSPAWVAPARPVLISRSSRCPGVVKVKERRVDMAGSANAPGTDDPHHLSRFVLAQQGNYEQAISEISSGRKRSHWMWYVFPQLDGLAFSSTSKFYAIKSLEEARAYLAHPLLGPRLLASAEVLARQIGRSANEIFGSPDDLKLRSCATLFACVSPHGSVFHRLLDKYFRGAGDGKTLRLLGLDTESGKIGAEE